jgi:hypothetical protein
MKTKMQLLAELFEDEQKLGIPFPLRFHKTKMGEILFKEALTEEQEREIVDKNFQLFKELKNKYED